MYASSPGNKVTWAMGILPRDRFDQNKEGLSYSKGDRAAQARLSTRTTLSPTLRYIILN